MSSTHPLSPLCVYCGASVGAREVYANSARELGRIMGERGIELIYGGGRAGLMGAVADGVLDAGGRVTGVITRLLVDKELAHEGVQDMRIVDTMHERKKIMADAARGFVALPGGVGTLDELFEILAWAQLGIHPHAVGLLNVEGYFDHLMTFMQHAAGEGFLRVRFEHEIVVHSDAGTLLSELQSIPRRKSGVFPEKNRARA